MWWWARSCDAICVCVWPAVAKKDGTATALATEDTKDGNLVVGFPHVQTEREN